MTDRIKEIKSFIEGELYNPYEGQEDRVMKWFNCIWRIDSSDLMDWG